MAKLSQLGKQKATKNLRSRMLKVSNISRMDKGIQVHLGPTFPNYRGTMNTA